MSQQPYRVTHTDIEKWKKIPFGFPFPTIEGGKRFFGFIVTNIYFVDSSGFGTDNEPALTVKNFVTKLIPGRYYAITGVGQFQVYITELIGRDRSIRGPLHADVRGVY